MKVICIDDKPRYKVRRGLHFSLEFGKAYDVISVQTDPPPFGESYELSVQTGVVYPSFHFVPTSKIDETEFERNYQKELI